MFGSIREKASATLAAASTAVNDRMDEAKGGKKIVDEGGESAAVSLLAKGAAQTAVSADNDLVARMEKAIPMYRDAAASLRSAAAGPRAEGITGYDEFATLAASYEARADSYDQVLKSLRGAPAALSMTASEKDALVMVQAKGHVTTIKGKSLEGVEMLKASAASGTNSCK